MREWYKAIFLSPHLDDAVLSCGGQIFMETAVKNPVLIVTIMAGEPAADVQMSEFARSLHQRWELARNAVMVRRAEDIVACQILGADYLHWSVPDCIYRADPATGEPCYPDWQAIITTLHPVDEAVLARLTRHLRQLPAAEQIVAPLTVGNHVDHRLTRLAAEQVFGERLIYYEDYPYAAESEAVTAVLNTTTQNWQASQIMLTETAVRAKTDAIWAYASQRSSFFADRTDLNSKIQQYTAQVGGERCWRPGRQHIPQAG
jgi:LmbE family N-acetylglucosaminyl deacetylase